MFLLSAIGTSKPLELDGMHTNSAKPANTSPHPSNLIEACLAGIVPLIHLWRIPADWTISGKKNIHYLILNSPQ